MMNEGKQKGALSRKGGEIIHEGREIQAWP